MTAMLFLAAIAATFFTVIAIEANSNTTLKIARPVGLLTWLTGGNWPAKIGGILIVIGVGALLRFALINIEIPSQLKLGMGFIIAFSIALISIFVPNNDAKRPISLALGGAAFGVAYITAYSAFAIFDYLSNPTGLALLLLISVATAVYAVTRSSLSLAIISMVGAFLAPAFAIKEAGPEIVYGYYIGASLLTFFMVAARGWRPLIHLSFLFSLVGGVFFAWTKQFNSPQYAEIMLPVLLILAAIHIVMPIMEKQPKNMIWMERLDLIYLLALPVVVVLSALNIAPNREVLSNELLGLAAIWVFPAIALRISRQQGSAAYILIASLLVVIALAARFKQLPWEILLLTISVSALALVAWMQPALNRLHHILAGLVLLLGIIYILSLAAASTPTPSFTSGFFLSHLAGAILLICAGAICRTIKQPLDTLLLAVGIGWTILTMGAEIIRTDLTSVAIVVHWTLILLGLSLWIPKRRIRIVDRNVTLLSTAILSTAAWSTMGSLTGTIVWLSMIGSAVALILIAVRPIFSDDNLNSSNTVGPRLTAVLMTPATVALWAFKAGEITGINSHHFVYSLAVLASLLALLSGRLFDVTRTKWLANASKIFTVLFALFLMLVTLVNIERTLSSVVLEWLCLVSLIGVVWLGRYKQGTANIIIAGSLLGLGLILQANILRLLGPEGHLDIYDIFSIRLPSIISLLWAIFGAGLTIWSIKIHSKWIWSAGATLLVAAAIKLILIDFGALGQLANILSVIAAGIVFLLVGWLAPMPPSKSSEFIKTAHLRNTKVTTANKYDNEKVGDGASSWVLALVIFTSVGFFQFNQSTIIVIRDVIVKPMSINHESNQLETPKIIQPLLENVSKPLQQSQTKPLVKPIKKSPVKTKPQAQEHFNPKVQPVRLDKQNQTNQTTIKEQLSAKPYTVTIGANGRPIYTQTSASVAANLSGSGLTESKIVVAKGILGLDQLVREGRMRRATARDVRAWLKATGRSEQRTSQLLIPDHASNGQYIFQTFVILTEMTVPEGLYGANSATFILPRNVLRPRGNLGHSRILEMP